MFFIIIFIRVQKDKKKYILNVFKTENPHFDALKVDHLSPLRFLGSADRLTPVISQESSIQGNKSSICCWQERRPFFLTLTAPFAIDVNIPAVSLSELQPHPPFSGIGFTLLTSGKTEDFSFLEGIFCGFVFSCCQIYIYGDCMCYFFLHMCTCVLAVFLLHIRYTSFWFQNSLQLKRKCFATKLYDPTKN